MFLLLHQLLQQQALLLFLAQVEESCQVYASLMIHQLQILLMTFMFVHFGLLQEVFAVLNCPDCASRIEIINDPRKRKGFSHQLSINCTSTSCDWNREFATSLEINKTFIKRKSDCLTLMSVPSLYFEKLALGTHQ